MFHLFIIILLFIDSDRQHEFIIAAHTVYPVSGYHRHSVHEYNNIVMESSVHFPRRSIAKMFHVRKIYIRASSTRLAYVLLATFYFYDLQKLRFSVFPARLLHIVIITRILRDRI